jgi:hypothetical protein
LPRGRTWLDRAVLRAGQRYPEQREDLGDRHTRDRTDVTVDRRVPLVLAANRVHRSFDPRSIVLAEDIGLRLTAARMAKANAQGLLGSPTAGRLEVRRRAPPAPRQRLEVVHHPIEMERSLPRKLLLESGVVEYIVVHELVHLREPHHTPEFWTRVERAMPDFAIHKQWLAEHAGQVVGL